MSVFILAIIKFELKVKDINITIIGTEVYCATCYWKEAQVFNILMRDIKYLAKKETKAKTNLKCIIPLKYHNFLNIFWKKNSNTFSSYWKYDYIIQVEKKLKLNYTPLYKISLQDLDTIKWYFDIHLTKRFI